MEKSKAMCLEVGGGLPVHAENLNGTGGPRAAKSVGENGASHCMLEVDGANPVHMMLRDKGTLPDCVLPDASKTGSEQARVWGNTGAPGPAVPKTDKGNPIRANPKVEAPKPKQLKLLVNKGGPK